MTEKVSIILLGPPGVGKTQLVEEAARELASELKREFVDWRSADYVLKSEVLRAPNKYFVYVSFSATHVEPVDLSGIPRVNGEYAEYKLLDFQHVLTLRGVAGILFLDEFTTDPRADRRASELKIINEATAGFRKFSDGVLVVAAGNTKKWSEMAETLDEPMRRGRAVVVFVRQPSLEEWLDWMNATYGDFWDRRVYAFLKMYPDRFFRGRRDDEAEDIEAGYRPLNSPRNWTKLAVLMASIEEIDDEEASAIIGGFTDPETAVIFTSFIKTAIPNWRELKTWDPGMPVEAKYLLLAQLAVINWREEFDRAADLLRTMDNESLNLLLSLIPEPKRPLLLTPLQQHLKPVFNKLKQTITDFKDVGI
jgi:DNA polymerase III delta prime subunit